MNENRDVTSFLVSRSEAGLMNGGFVNFSFQRCTGFGIFRDFQGKAYCIMEFRSNVPSQVCVFVWVSATLSESGSVSALMSVVSIVLPVTFENTPS